MKNARPRTAEASALDTRNITAEKVRKDQFTGTNNPRDLRIIHALLRRSMPREQVDKEAGCSNGPELIAELRRRGLNTPCAAIPVIDRDGREVRRGVYFLTNFDRRKIGVWISKRGVSDE